MPGDPNIAAFKALYLNLPLYVKRLIITILQSIFTEDTLFDAVPNPYQLKFDDNGEVSGDSKMIIANVFSTDLGKTDPRPIIVIKRGAFGFSNEFIGDAINSHGFDSKTGTAKYVDRVVLSLEITAYSRNSLEAESISWLCALFLRTFRHVIMKYVNLHKIYPPTTGEAVPIDIKASFDYFRCDTTIVLEIPFGWEVTQTDIDIKIDRIMSKFYLDYAKNIPFFEGNIIVNPVHVIEGDI